MYKKASVMPRHESDDNPILSAQFTMAMIAVFIAVFGAQFTRANLSALGSYPWRLGDGECRGARPPSTCPDGLR